MSRVIETKIDERGRTGALSGVATPGERFQVERPSRLEIRMKLLEPVEHPPAKVVKRDGRLMISLGRPVDMDELNKALADYL